MCCGHDERGLIRGARLQCPGLYYCGGAGSHGGYAEKVVSGHLAAGVLVTGVAFDNECVSFVLGDANSASRLALLPESRMIFKYSVSRS
jgi:hypothetical protein